MVSFNLEALKEALEDSVLLDLAEVDAIPERKMKNPDALLRNIYEKHEENKKAQKRLTGKRLIALIIAAALLIATAITAVAFKEKLLDFFEKKEDTHTSFSSPGGENANEEIKEVFLPTYIPENFTLKSHEANSFSVFTVWNDGESDIYIKQIPIKNTDLSLNTEDGNYTEALFGNQAVYYTVKYGKFSAFWHTDDYVFSFSAPWEPGLEELEKTIASISFDRSIQ